MKAPYSIVHGHVKSEPFNFPCLSAVCCTVFLILLVFVVPLSCYCSRVTVPVTIDDE